MQNIKKVLVIVPMIFLLSMSFGGINAKAEDNVDKQEILATASKNTTSGNTTSTNTTSGNTTIVNTTSVQDKESNKSSSTKEDSKTNKVKENTTENKDTDLSSQGEAKDQQNQDSSIVKNEETTVMEKFPLWKTIDGRLYYVTKDGILKETGWFKEKDENPDAKNDYEYYLDKNHAATIGWSKIQGSWYYFDEAGIKQTGWKLIDYEWYHLDKNGIMKTGWLEDEGEKYYLNAQGARVLKKKYIEDKWYFFGDVGILQTGIYSYKGKYYYSTKEGVMGENEWISIKSDKYYVKADSSLATGDAIINNVMSKFDSDGKYIGRTQIKDRLFIKYLNVGNADCEFIKLPSGETVLIDTGEAKTSQEVADFLKKQDLKQEEGKGVIDYIVITHGHSDHIGGLTSILDKFKVKKVYIPDIARMKDWYSDVEVTRKNKANIEMLKSEYKVYQESVQAMEDKDLEFTNTKKGEFIDKYKILEFVQADKSFGPLGSDKVTEDYWSMNESSALVYLNYGDLQALFAADMEWNSEKDFWVNDLLDERDVDVLKVPHHGADTSSTADYIRYLKPDIGIISRSEKSIEKNIAYVNLTSNGVGLYETSSKNGISIYATPENWTVS